MKDWRAKVNRYTAGGDVRRFLTKVPDRLCRDAGRRVPGLFYPGRVRSKSASATLIGNALLGPSPLAISRLGATEQRVLSAYRSKHGGEGRYSPDVRHDISALSGVHPNDDRTLDRFSELYLSCIPSIDILGVWFHKAERSLVKTLLPPTAALVPLICLDPISSETPWAASLAGRRVCVVHPFAKTIQKQYDRRRSVFPDERHLPDFDLTTVRAVQGIGGLSDGFENWFDALDSMSEAIAKSAAEVVLGGQSADAGGGVPALRPRGSAQRRAARGQRRGPPAR